MSIPVGILKIADKCMTDGTPLPADTEIAVLLRTETVLVANSIYLLRKNGHLVLEKTDAVRVVLFATTEYKSGHSAASARESIVALVEYCTREGKRWPPRENIAKALKISRESLVKHMDFLVESNAIIRVKRGVYRPVEVLADAP